MTIANDGDVVPPGPGPYVTLGDPDLVRVVGDAAGTLQDLHWRLHRTRLEEIEPVWDARLAAVEVVVADLRARIAARRRRQ
jgi:hypothetical protein